MLTNAIGELVVKTHAANAPERKTRQRRMMEMRSRIAELKAEVKEPGTNELLEAELSLLQMELFWMMKEL